MLRELRGQRSAIAQFIPATTLPPTLMPEFASTLPMTIGARYAMPYRGVAPNGALGPVAVPVVCVP